jgi:hypothetical protein
MKIKHLLIVIFLASPNIFIGQNLSAEISDNEIINFISWEIQNSDNRKKIYYRIKSWTEKNFKEEKDINKRDFDYRMTYLFKKENELNTIFTEKDIKYLQKQSNSIRTTEWKINFKNAKVSKRRKKTHIYSIPLFSKDRKHVIIYKEFWRGLENSIGGYYIYQKIDGNWKLIKRVNGFIS